MTLFIIFGFYYFCYALENDFEGSLSLHKLYIFFLCFHMLVFITEWFYVCSFCFLMFFFMCPGNYS
ncbi:hypothetical protein CDL12_22206 [Handroanthus impetiginosus]|uniref:Uncharacterized protein n=1 Tax=Handroanthus impetiginosus TaxID=429701 RepID=A0A2G9GJP2_9LAMI|nr:hypothetical protein CDL12_22206 [Handroanthus impetiginosus]